MADKKIVRKVALTGVKGKDGKTYWHEVGVAFVNENSISVKLFATPVNGEIVLKDPIETKKGETPTA